MPDLTDAQKIDQLWGRLDSENKEKASLQLALDVAEAKIERMQGLLVQQTHTIDALTAEIQRLGREVNSARAAAASSVHDYIARTG